MFLGSSRGGAPRTLANTHVPGVLPERTPGTLLIVNTHVPDSRSASKYVCSWGPPREDSRNASEYACSSNLPGRTPGTLVNTHVRDPRHDTTRDNTHTQPKKRKRTNRNYERYIPKLLQNTRKAAPQNLKQLPKIDQKSIKNESRSSPGDPSGQRPVFDTFFVVFWTKMVSKMEPETTQKIRRLLLVFPMSFYFDF